MIESGADRPRPDRAQRDGAGSWNPPVRGRPLARRMREQCRVSSQQPRTSQPIRGETAPGRDRKASAPTCRLDQLRVAMTAATAGRSAAATVGRRRGSARLVIVSLLLETVEGASQPASQCQASRCRRSPSAGCLRGPVARSTLASKSGVRRARPAPIDPAKPGRCSVAADALRRGRSQCERDLNHRMGSARGRSSAEAKQVAGLPDRWYNARKQAAGCEASRWMS